MIDNNELIASLNDLTAISIDGEDCFQSCAENASNPRLVEYFKGRASEVSKNVPQLQELVRMLGGTPVDSVSISGFLNTRWLNLKTAISSNDNLTILDEVVSGEDHAVSAYFNLLELSLPVQVGIVLSRQYIAERRNQDYAQHLKEIFESDAIHR